MLGYVRTILQWLGALVAAIFVNLPPRVIVSTAFEADKYFQNALEAWDPRAAGSQQATLVRVSLREPN